VLVHPNIDPIAFSIGPLAVRWYGLMYLGGFVIGWWLGVRRINRGLAPITRQQLDDLLFLVVLGVILGGRLGYVLFYKPGYYFSHPLEILYIWQGGMSFHGGLLGAMIAVAIFAARRQRQIADVLDFMAPLPGPGILAGRIGNFINGELWGKPTDAPWGFTVDPAVLHPMQAAEARRLCERFEIDPCVLHVHASQLYEGLLEGLLLFVILWVFTAKPRPRLAPSGLFLICYGVLRFIVEFVRVPDENRGYLLLDWVTMGQILSTPMILGGLVLLAIAYRRNQPSGNLQLQTT
jgi:phosphatidylglycerol---prolipoprotein diacylglyceryl transferase